VKYVSIYDSFTITVLITLEDLGFCPKGQGGKLVADGNLISGVRHRWRRPLQQPPPSSMLYVGMRGTAPCARFVSFFRGLAQGGSIRERISNGNFLWAPHEQNVMSRIVDTGPRDRGVAAENPRCGP
jgi:hypothetical protein